MWGVALTACILGFLDLLLYFFSSESAVLLFILLLFWRQSSLFLRYI
jgi:hypothetical protein